MNRLDPDQPSIFSRPDPEIEERRPSSLTGPTDHDVWRPSRPTVNAPIRPPVSPDPSAVATEGAGPGTRRQLFVLGSMGLGILALAGFVAASILGPAPDDPALAGASSSPVPTASASASATASDAPSATAAASAAPSDRATPAATPGGPPQELVTGGWATVEAGELNVRREPTLAAPVDYRLVRGAVVHLEVQASEDADGLAWYRIVSLGGARGWAASGPADAPFLEMFSTSDELRHCGAVESAVFEVTGGAIDRVDPIRVGGLALPAGAFDDVALGGLELVRASGQELACISAVMDAGTARLSLDMAYEACGAVAAASGLHQLVPPPGDRPEGRYVAEPALVHPALMARQGPDHPISRNFGAVLTWADDANGVACWQQSFSGLGRVELSARQCGVVEQVTADTVTIATPSGSVILEIWTAGSEVDPALPIGVETGMVASIVEDAETHLVTTTVGAADVACS